MDVGSGRLRLLFQGHAGVPYFPDPSAARPLSFTSLQVGYFDARFDEPCWPEPIGAESFLCLSNAWAEAEPALSLDGYASCLSDSLEARRKRDLPILSCNTPLPTLRGFWSRSGGPAGSLCFDGADGGYQLRGAREFTADVTYSQVSPVDPEQPPVCDAASTNSDLDYFLPDAPLEPDLVGQIRVRTLLP
jgi:hypothetical protein